MRKIVAFDRVSADGCFAAADGGLGWVVPEDEIDKGAADNLGENDTILFGRRTYEMFESFWPHVTAESPGPDPHTPGRYAPAMVAMAGWINQARKIVFSRTRGEVTWTNSEVRRELDPGEIEALKQAPGKGIMLFGSGTVASQLTEHGLIDEYHFVVGPVALGSGRALLSGVSRPARLKLLECRQYPSGNVMLRYARA